jgi:RNA polymerase sigma-70 factor (ECF subfamily)
MRRDRAYTPTGEQDAAIIAGSCQQPERFAAVFDRHAPVIYRYLLRRVGRGSADDLVAETFLVAFAKRRSYDPRRPDARPWLYGIATNVVAQHRRDEVRWCRLLATACDEPETPGHADRVVADATAGSVRSLLAKALAGLAGVDRDVLLLVAYEELSYEEVARALAIPVGTVRSRLHRARAQLREALAGTAVVTVYEEIMSDE